MTDSIPSADPHAKRAIWHSRRGMLELDVFLLPFAEEAYSTLSSDDQALYRRLLNYEDPDLFTWFLEHTPAEDAELSRMVEMVRAHARQRG
ncbi:MAG: succinate dehydrogenase assembly factor 2 [Oleibacter sp.]|nr:succinate dehydrogenase assembly factor 2 [Thalassolituus sp.]